MEVQLAQADVSMNATLLLQAGFLSQARVCHTSGPCLSAGAYNRTLTPFGFQSEERTLWQAPEIYSKMSPFM
jgi:hypothetical protein